MAEKIIGLDTIQRSADPKKDIMHDVATRHKYSHHPGAQRMHGVSPYAS